MRSTIVLTLALVLSATATLAPKRAEASGFYLIERGMRTLGRGGAFVAGAEGSESLWINPAGLANSGNTFHMEANQTFLRGSFQRIDDEGQVSPTVDLKTAFLPIPLLGVTNNFGFEDFTFGFGFYVPTLSLYTWPDHVGREPAPNRYSLYSLKGSIFGNFSTGVAYHGIPGLSIGVSAALIAGRFKASQALSACDGFLCVNQEDPNFDATAVITLKRFATVMIGAGLIYGVGPIKFGASMQTPWTIQGDADIDVRLPADPAFAHATVSGKRGSIKVPFPLIGRVGLEYKANDALKMEVAVVYEGWSRQQEITVKANKMVIRDVVGIGDYQVGTIKIQRLMSDSLSFRGGFEYFLEESNITLRAGASYDQTAIKDKALTPLTLDANKVVVGLGVTLHVGSVFDFNMLYGHVFMPDRQVRTSEVTQPTAIRPGPSEPSHIGNGNYGAAADFAGIGSTFKF